jgi:hypothetical protein
MAKHPKRPKDPVSRAVQIGRMLVGDAPKDAPPAQPTAKAKAGAKGGAARAKAISKADRSAIAKKAAAKRWNPES